jgi:ribonuclease Z
MTQIYPDMHISVRPPGSPASPSRVASLDNFHPALANPSLISESLPEATRALYTQLKEEVASVPKPESAPGDDVRIIPLGTSSAVPSKYRNG